jgi:integrase
MRTPEFPWVKKKGSRTVTIYKREYQKRTKDGAKRDYREYILVWYDDKGGRNRETSADLMALQTRALEVLEDLKEGRTDGGALRASQRNDYLRACHYMAPTGIALDVGARHFAEAVKILGGDLVIAAAQDYARRNKGVVHCPVSKAVEEFVAAQERREQLGKLSNVHVTRQAARLRAFAESAQMNVASVTADDIDAFLDSRGGSPRTRDNWADEIAAFYNWAKLKRHVPKDFDETERITRLDSDQDGPIEIYTPEEMQKLLTRAESTREDKEMIPLLAIGAFAGLRTSEIMRLDWADIRTENGNPHIVVEKGKVKKRTKSRRIVPMPVNLKAWLTTCRKEQGPVWKWSEPQLHVRLRELAEKAEVDRKPNAARHSFISYRMAIAKNDTAVSLEAGNSAQMIYSNYRELVTEDDAQKWFGIVPTKKV